MLPSQFTIQRAITSVLDHLGLRWVEPTTPSAPSDFNAPDAMRIRIEVTNEDDVRYYIDGDPRPFRQSSFSRQSEVGRALSIADAAVLNIRDRWDEKHA